MRIAVVHGIRQYRGEPAEAVPHYTALWSRALSAAPGMPFAAEQVDLRPAYYAHLLVEPGRQGIGLAPDAEELLTVLLEPWLPDTAGAQGPLTWPFRIALSRLAERWRLPEKQVTRFLERFVNEVATFLRTEGDFTPKERVTAAVAEAIAGADVVVAHSLGSVVAYETLWANQLEVPLLVTVGSPLAIPRVIHPRLTPAPVDGRGARPPGVRQWSNLADHGDFVDIPPGGSAKAFEGVHEDLHGSIAAFDFHRITKYLSSPFLGSILADWHDAGMR